MSETRFLLNQNLDPKREMKNVELPEKHGRSIRPRSRVISAS